MKYYKYISNTTAAPELYGASDCWLPLMEIGGVFTLMLFLFTLVLNKTKLVSRLSQRAQRRIHPLHQLNSVPLASSTFQRDDPSPIDLVGLNNSTEEPANNFQRDDLSPIDLVELNNSTEEPANNFQRDDLSPIDLAGLNKSTEEPANNFQRDDLSPIHHQLAEFSSSSGKRTGIVSDTETELVSQLEDSTENTAKQMKDSRVIFVTEYKAGHDESKLTQIKTLEATQKICDAEDDDDERRNDTMDILVDQEYLSAARSLDLNTGADIPIHKYKSTEQTNEIEYEDLKKITSIDSIRGTAEADAVLSDQELVEFKSHQESTTTSKPFNMDFAILAICVAGIAFLVILVFMNLEYGSTLWKILLGIPYRLICFLPWIFIFNNKEVNAKFRRRIQQLRNDYQL